MRRWDPSLLLSVGLAAGFLLLSAWVVSGRTAAFDAHAVAFVREAASPVLTATAKGLHAIGGVGGMILLVVLTLGILYAGLRLRRELVWFVGVQIGSFVTNELLKRAIARSRPIEMPVVDVSGYSYPSGHAMAAVAFCGALAMLLWPRLSTRGRGLLLAGCVLWPFAMGVSRVYLGVHYPTDVVGAYLAGGSWLCFAVWLKRRAVKRAPTVSGRRFSVPR